MKNKCVICGKSLSIYNESDRCFFHNESTPPPERFMITLCTSFPNYGLVCANVDYYGEEVE